MKPAILLSATILIAATIVATSLSNVGKKLDRLAYWNRNPNGTVHTDRPIVIPSRITVVPPPEGFLTTARNQPGDNRGPVATAPAGAEAYSHVTNVRLVEDRMSPEQLDAAPKTLIGRWRDENSHVEYRADGTCTWEHDNGSIHNNDWRIEADTIFETESNGEKGSRRILQLDERHYVYQQFPGGSIWRATRVAARQPEESKQPMESKQPTESEQPTEGEQPSVSDQ